MPHLEKRETMSVVSRAGFGCLVLACVAQGCALSDGPDPQMGHERDVTPDAETPPPAWSGDPAEERARAAQEAADTASEIDGDELVQASSLAGAGTWLAAACDDDPLGSFDYCSSTCLCGIGEGDCDDDDDCDAGMACMRDTGALFGFDPEVDVCMERCSADGLGTPDFCSSECPCEAGQGDCDRNSDCATGNICAKNVGASFGFAPDVDVCIDVCDPVLNGTFDYCSSACLCEHGQGDCDSDADCAPGHVCARDVGASYGFDPEMDVCEEIQVPQESFTGRVLDDQGSPVAGAAVSINQVSVATDEDGLFALSVDVTVDGRYVINVEKFRYVPHSSIHIGGGIADLTLIIPEAQMVTLTPETTDIEGHRGTRIELSQRVQDVLVDENGEPPKGPVVAQVHTFDVANEGMVGNMEAVDASGNIVALESVGAVSVDFFDLDGKKYRLGPGKTAEITLDLPPGIEYSGPIPLWHYDMEQGRWVEEGEGMVQDGMAFATVTHFSAWNFDIKFTRSSCIKITTSLGQNQSLEARIDVLPGAGSDFPPRTQIVTLAHNGALSEPAANEHILFNLPPNTDVRIRVPRDGTSLDIMTNTGEPWAPEGQPGVGVPDSYDDCNGVLTPSGAPVVVGILDGQIRGSVSLQHRSDPTGIRIDVTPTGGGTSYTDTTEGDGVYAIAQVDPGVYRITYSHQALGHIPVERSVASDETIDVEGGRVHHLPCIRLLAGDVDEDRDIDDADETALQLRIGLTSPPRFDLDGVGGVTTTDLNLLRDNRAQWGDANGVVQGPLPAGHPASQCTSSDVRNITAGGLHTCALMEAGKVRCWGASGNGQLGYGTTGINYGEGRNIGDDETLISVSKLSMNASVSQISTGGYHSCALVSGDVRCWGYGNAGQLGLGGGQDSNIGDDEDSADLTAYARVDVGFSVNVAELVTGLFHTCARSQNGKVRCWGDNAYGQLGYPGRANVGINETPAAPGIGDVDVGGDVIQLAAGAFHTCALLAGSQLVKCWGANHSGQLGYGTTDNVGDDERPAQYPPNEPRFVDPKDDANDVILELVAGYEHTCALLNESRMRCWGAGNHGQLGYGNTARVLDPATPLQSVSLRNAGDPHPPSIRLVAGGQHTCALLGAASPADVKVKCWGRGNFGQLGHGNTNNVLSPIVEVSPGVDLNVNLSGTPVRLTAGLYHTCALLASGNVQCWGYGGFGQLGYGNTNDIGDSETPREAGSVPFLD